MRSPASASLSRFGASTRTREFGERQTLIGFLPEATHLLRPTRRFHLLSIGAQGPENLSVLADRAGLLHQRHIGKLHEVTDENRPLGPERQVGSTYPAPTHHLPHPPSGPRKKRREAPCPTVPWLIQLLPFFAVLKPNSVIRP